MGKDTWDAVLASTPLNVTAGRVTAKGVSFAPAAQFSEISWDAPPPLLRPSRKHTANPSFVDFTGQRVGRLTVLGMAAERIGADGALWVCRCVCGRYVGRRAKGLKKASIEAKCNHCDYSEKLRVAASGDNARQRASSEKATWHQALVRQGR